MPFLALAALRLDNFDGPAVAEKAIEFSLHEEAFEIYKKFNKKVSGQMQDDLLGPCSADDTFLKGSLVLSNIPILAVLPYCPRLAFMVVPCYLPPC